MAPNVWENLKKLAQAFSSVVLQLIIRLFQGKDAARSYNNKIFATELFRGSAEYYDEQTRFLKTELFKPLSLRQKPRILEIGIGDGGNFHYYPQNSTLLALDPNPYFEPYLRKKLEMYPGLQLEKLHHGYGEDMSTILPESVDAVVTVNVLCSVGNMKQVLEEIHRVLKPGGVYYFLEHSLDHDTSSFRHYGQRFLTATRIWPTAFGECHFRDCASVVRGSKFEEVDIQFSYSPPNYERWCNYFIRSYTYGTAKKS